MVVVNTLLDFDCSSDVGIMSYPGHSRFPFSQTPSKIETPSKIDHPYQNENVPMRIPPFSYENINMWLCQMEAFFKTQRITDDEMKYNYIVSNLDVQCIEKIKNFIKNTNHKGSKYEGIKSRLSNVARDLESDRIIKLLKPVTIGNSTPTEFYEIIKNRCKKKFEEDLLIREWKKGLPEEIQRVINLTQHSVANTSQTLQIADSVHDIMVKKNNANNERNEASGKTSVTLEGRDFDSYVTELENYIQVFREKCDEFQSLIDNFKSRTGKFEWLNTVD